MIVQVIDKARAPDIALVQVVLDKSEVALTVEFDHECVVRLSVLRQAYDIF